MCKLSHRWCLRTAAIFQHTCLKFAKILTKLGEIIVLLRCCYISRLPPDFVGAGQVFCPWDDFGAEKKEPMKGGVPKWRCYFFKGIVQCQ